MAFGAYALSMILVSVSLIIIKRQNEFDQLANKKLLNDSYDYIVVGAGSAGSVVASRLSEDPDRSVLLIEAGGSETVVTTMPARTGTFIGSYFDWNYTTVKQTRSCLGIQDQRLNWPRGRMLGGTSAFNDMVYLRGNPNDFDAWETVHGAKGWSWQSVLKYFKKSENNTDASINKNGFHGVGGPMTVSTPADVHPIIRQWVGASIRNGYRPGDLNSGRGSGTMVTQRTVNSIGVRASTASAFLVPVYSKRPNLNIYSNSMATRIIFDGLRALAVEFVHANRTRIVRANREIIVSAGTIGSPHLLMLSGIGPKEHLNQLNIKTVADLPVGRNLHDHPRTYGVHFLMNATMSSWDGAINEETLKSYFIDGRGPLSRYSEAMTHFQTSQVLNGSVDWPDIQLGIYLGSPASSRRTASIGLGRIKPDVWDKFYRRYQNRAQFSINVMLMRTKSRGTITLKSRDLNDQPLIDPNYYSDPNQTDVKAMVAGVREAYRIALSPAMSCADGRFNVAPYETLVPGCERLHNGNFSWPPDEYLECLVRTLTSSGAHQAGTCKMGGGNDPTAVVDERLRVRGSVTGLRVIDASVMPEVVSTNTNAAAVMIGEMGADLVKQDNK